MPAGISNDFVGVAKTIRGRCCKWATRQYRLSVESPKEGKSRRAKVAKRARQYRSTVSPEKKEQMLARARAWKARNREHISKYNKQYRLIHLEELRQREYNRYWTDPEKARAKARTWQANRSPESREKRLVYTREYNQKYIESGKKREADKKYYWAHREELIRKSVEQSRVNPEKVRERYRRFYAKNRKKVLQGQREYRKAHPEKGRANCRRRRARLALTIHTLTPKQEIGILSAGCFFCGTTENLTIAHDIPAIKFGNVTLGNCFCLCQSCNSKMRTKSLAEVIEQKELF